MDPSPALILSFPSSVTAADRDRLVAVLADFGVQAIQEDEVVRPSRWIAHFEQPAARDAAAAAIRAAPGFQEIDIASSDVEDEDWARRTQADLPAIRIGRVIVAPPWDIPDDAALRATSPAAGALSGSPVVVVIEPSRGFGTGHHQSTRLCLTLLQSLELAGRTVVDVGTGSGVLAITAARLGAAFVAAIDVDADAIENARENAALNGVAGTVEAHVADLATTTVSPADVVTANLTGSLLERHAADLRRLVKPAGALIVAGFTVEECDRVIAAFAPAMDVTSSAEEEGWWAVGLRGSGGAGGAEVRRTS